ncbi:MAG: putative zinc-binding protein [Armatimonadetes bacterium]|nr:putative zinc-binding protein [Armatimonadota bacterium]
MIEDTEFKVAVLPCNGIGRLVSTVVRLAGYRIKRLRPDQVVLLSSGRLAVKDPEHVAAFEKYPVLVIDGCRPHCASFMADELGKTPAARIYMADVAAENRISIAGDKRRGLTEKGEKLVNAVTDKAVAEIDRIIADEMLSTL